MADSAEIEASKETGKKTLVMRLRNYFLTGLLVDRKSVV